MVKNAAIINKQTFGQQLYQYKQTKVLVNNATSINKGNKQLSPKITEHRKTMTYGVRNPGLRHVQKCEYLFLHLFHILKYVDKTRIYIFYFKNLRKMHNN